MNKGEKANKPIAKTSSKCEQDPRLIPGIFTGHYLLKNHLKLADRIVRVTGKSSC